MCWRNHCPTVTSSQRAQPCPSYAPFVTDLLFKVRLPPLCVAEALTSELIDRLLDGARLPVLWAVDVVLILVLRKAGILHQAERPLQPPLHCNDRGPLFVHIERAVGAVAVLHKDLPGARICVVHGA